MVLKPFQQLLTHVSVHLEVISIPFSLLLCKLADLDKFQ